MHRNENKYDQLFRNRLRDLYHPVRNELWSRIHSGIRGRKPSVPNPGTKLPFLSSNGYLSTLVQKLRFPGLAAPSRILFFATSFTMAVAAALAITLGIIHFTHTTPPRLAQPVNHYSTIAPAKAPASSTGESSVTPQSSSHDRSGESATAVQPSHGASASKIDRDSSNLSHEAGASRIDRSLTHGDHITPGDRLATVRRHHTSAYPGAHGMSAATETTPGTPGMDKTAATRGKQNPRKQTPGKQTMEGLYVHRHNGNPVTLPAMAPTSIRATITASSPGSKSLHNGFNSPGNWPALPSFHRTGSVSLYASPDFPNHFYTWSYTVGGRLTFQFSRRWSFTSGFEYARVNVPSQIVPGNSSLVAFHFSNYEVPVLFGYTRTSRHGALTVYGGAIINLYFHASTSAYIDNLPDRDSYGAVLGVEYSYSLGRHLAIFAQPYARYSISDYRMFTQTQRWSFGTLLGIKYRL